MNTILISISIYIVSTFLIWKYIQIAHSSKGIWSNLNTNYKDLFITICPVLNTIFILVWFFMFPYKQGEESNCNSFFKIRR